MLLTAFRGLSNFSTVLKEHKTKTIWSNKVIDALFKYIKMMNFHYSTCAQQIVQNDQKYRNHTVYIYITDISPTTTQYQLHFLKTRAV